MKMNPTQFNVFIEKIKNYSESTKVTNQYKTDIQIENLTHYLINMDNLNPTILFVGEAPGYNGCRLTGIPFTSEDIITKHSKSGIFLRCKASGSQSESSATILWNKLDDLARQGKMNTPPLLWNVFPFHPHKNNNLLSNRKPSKKEVKDGLSFLHDLIELFPSIDYIYAIGKVAESSISNFDKYSRTIRHPANGGKPKMDNDIDDIFL